MVYSKNKYRKRLIRILAVALPAILIFNNSIISFADTVTDRIAAHEAMTVDTNEIENWPQGPVIAAESAILMDASSGAILYAKNIHKRQYPASTTKILTTLIAYEECSLSEIVDFSRDAVYSIPAGSNNIAMDAGEQLTMDESIKAILIRSANEVSYAVAEHISGSFDAFADLMNKRAKELGCIDSNFVNPNGLPDENHYTSAYDLAMIGKAFFANEYLCEVTMTPMLHIEPSDRQPDDIWDANKMLLLPGKEYAYEYLVGCKTGYTDASRSTLVSCAQKDGLKLICVVLNDENPNYYQDTIALFNYGFSNFDKINISQTDTKYNIESAGSFYSANDIFGSSVPILTLNKYDCIILPKTIDFSDVESGITYETENENQAALITYTYNGTYLGAASVDFTINESNAYTFDSIEINNTEETNEKTTSFVFVNIVKIMAVIATILILIFLFLVIRKLSQSYSFFSSNSRRAWHRNSRRRGSRKRLHHTSRKNIRAQRRAAIRQAKKRAKATAASKKRRNLDF